MPNSRLSSAPKAKSIHTSPKGKEGQMTTKTDTRRPSATNIYTTIEDDAIAHGLSSDDDDDDIFDEENNHHDEASVAGSTESYDDDYSGLPDFSDDDTEVDRENGFLKSAEDDLISEFERTEHRSSTAAVADDFDNMFLQEADVNVQPMHGSEISFEFDPLDMNNDPFDGLDATDPTYMSMWENAELEMKSWRLSPTLVQRMNSNDSGANKKRVRFQEEPAVETRSRSSSTSASEDANEIFPDLFDAQDDPLLRQQFALDVDIDATFEHDLSDAGSCYDFDDDADERLAYNIDEAPGSDSDADEVSSTSSLDEGDTTDEETEEECMARMRAMQRAKGIMRSPRLAPTTPTAANRSSSRRLSATPKPVTPRSAKPPQSGEFRLDPTRAAVSEDGSRKVKLIPPSKPIGAEGEFWRRVKNSAKSNPDSPASSHGLSFLSPAVSRTPQRPFTAQSTLGTMFDGNLDFMRVDSTPQTVPDPIALSSSFFIPLSQPSFGSATLTEDSDGGNDDVRMQDFVDLGNEDSDDDEQDLRSLVRIDSDEETATGAHSSEYGLLDHLDQQRGLVGSFRMNQTQAKHISSLASHPAKRALTSESNALQKSRRAAANAPMTPARKKRGSRDLGLTGAGIRKAVDSPLTNRRPRSRGTSISAAGMQQTLGQAFM